MGNSLPTSNLVNTARKSSTRTNQKENVGVSCGGNQGRNRGDVHEEHDSCHHIISHPKATFVLKVDKMKDGGTQLKGRSERESGFQPHESTGEAKACADRSWPDGGFNANGRQTVTGGASWREWQT